MWASTAWLTTPRIIGRCAQPTWTVPPPMPMGAPGGISPPGHRCRKLSTSSPRPITPPASPSALPCAGSPIRRPRTTSTACAPIPACPVILYGQTPAAPPAWSRRPWKPRPRIRGRCGPLASMASPMPMVVRATPGASPPPVRQPPFQKLPPAIKTRPFPTPQPWRGKPATAPAAMNTAWLKASPVVQSPAAPVRGSAAGKARPQRWSI